jgi:hypothetical protein
VVRSEIAPMRVDTSPPRKSASRSEIPLQIAAPVPSVDTSVCPGSTAEMPTARPSAASSSMAPTAQSTPPQMPPQETRRPSASRSTKGFAKRRRSRSRRSWY